VGQSAPGAVMHLSHEGFKTDPMISDGNDWKRRGIRLHNNRSPPGPILVSLGFQLGVTVRVQFDHWDGCLGVCAWAGGDIARGGLHPLGILSAETMLEEDLECCRHSAALSKSEGPQNKIRQDRGDGNQDYTACPFASGWIHIVLLFLCP